MDRSLRLREEWEVNETRRRGKAYPVGPLVARIMAQTSPRPSNRYAVIAGRKIGGSVERNRCKRLVREALRALHPNLRQGYDIAIIIRGGPDQLTSLAVATDTLTSIFTRANMFHSQSVSSPDERPSGEPGR